MKFLPLPESRGRSWELREEVIYGIRQQVKGLDVEVKKARCRGEKG